MAQTASPVPRCPRAQTPVRRRTYKMKKRNVLIGSLLVALLIVGVSVYAQVNRPYRNGSVWNIGFIRIKSGMDSAYLNYVAGEWKTEQEAQKKDGNILSYKVMSVEGHTTTEFNLMLMTEYKNLAAMEANEDKAEAVARKVIGNDAKQMQGYNERSAIREVIGDRL